MKEKLVPLIQGPSDTKELHISRWLSEIRKPESLLAPDLLAFSVLVPQQGDDCRNSGRDSLFLFISFYLCVLLPSDVSSHRGSTSSTSVSGQTSHMTPHHISNFFTAKITQAPQLYLNGVLLSTYPFIDAVVMVLKCWNWDLSYILHQH